MPMRSDVSRMIDVHWAPEWKLGKQIQPVACGGTVQDFHASPSFESVTCAKCRATALASVN